MKDARAHEHKFQAQDDGWVLAERGGRVRKAGTELRSFAGAEEEVRMRVVVVHAVPSSWLSQCTCWGGGAGAVLPVLVVGGGCDSGWRWSMETAEVVPFLRGSIRKRRDLTKRGSVLLS